MTGLGSVGLAFALLAFFWLVGLGLIWFVRPVSLPFDGAVAIAPVLGVAVFSLIASAVVLRLPTHVALTVAVGVPLLVTAAGARRLVRERPRVFPTLAGLGAVAAIAIFLASIPFLSHQSGAAATWGNADPYLWVSQARSLLAGPAPLPATFFPDHVAYSHLTSDGWAPGLPSLTALPALTVGRDPVGVFGAVSAMLFALMPLASFAFARTALGWSPRLSFTAAAVVALNPYRLFSSFYGWQPQVAGVACILALVLAFRIALDTEADWLRPTGLAAALVAGALGIYRLPFVPYLLLAVTATAVGYFVKERRRGTSAALRRLTARSASLAAFSAVLAAPSLAGFIRGAGKFWRHDAAIVSWSHYSRALPSEAIGLLPRAPDLDKAIGGDSFRLFAGAVAVALIIRGLARVRNQSGAYPDLLISLVVAVLAAATLAQLPMFTPYWSIKLMAYGAVPFVLAVLAPLHGRRLPPKDLIGAAVLMLASTAAVANAGRHTQTASAFEPLTAAVARLPPGETISIDYTSTWKQMWAIYFTRDHATSVAHASDYLAGFELSAASYVHPARWTVSSLLSDTRSSSRDAGTRRINPDPSR